MKLELKHLAAYLPYGLKMKVCDTSFYKYDTMTLCDKGGLSNIGLSYVVDEPQDFKPILRPLSMLSKKVEDEFDKYNSNKPYDQEIIDLFCLEFTNNEEPIDSIKNILSLPYLTCEYALRNHYDIFNLIENNLAIDKTAIE